MTLFMSFCIPLNMIQDENTQTAADVVRYFYMLTQNLIVGKMEQLLCN